MSAMGRCHILDAEVKDDKIQVKASTGSVKNLKVFLTDVDILKAVKEYHLIRFPDTWARKFMFAKWIVGKDVDVHSMGKASGELKDEIREARKRMASDTKKVEFKFYNHDAQKVSNNKMQSMIEVELRGKINEFMGDNKSSFKGWTKVGGKKDSDEFTCIATFSKDFVEKNAAFPGAKSKIIEMILEIEDGLRFEETENKE